ncbi:MAG: protein kinase [Bryobacteraceae bacterium]|nr:protein kinase [Bryobacteraceae bacterium]
MNERWQRVKSILAEALERPFAERAAYLHEACAGDTELRREVESLLLADEDAGEFLNQPAIEPANAVGWRLGPYRTLELIGQGGMGAVYRAVRDDDEFQQEVAIKLIRRGVNSDYVRSRFLYERQILAFLNHPHIARLLDGGTTEDGLPYFVMEFVEGSAIDEYCILRQLPLRPRLELFLKACSAVEYAHRNLIVHRDLKPSNILITEDGTPKLLDFGIAKLLLPDHPHLAPAQTSLLTRALTPDYASPEQIRGEAVTTATDVYSLGVLLYELLTGKKAHRFNTHTPGEIERVVCEVEAVRPSSLNRELAGDLDQILGKALEKDPGQRYGSVEQFAADIRRYLTGQPVNARSHTLLYRVSKFVKRRKGVVLAVAAIILTLLGGIATTTREARIAQRRFNDVRKLANSLIGEHDAFASIPGSTAQRGRLVQQALSFLDDLYQDASDDPQMQRELAVAYEKLGDVQGRADGPNLGKTEAAIDSYRKSLLLREALAKTNGEDEALSGLYVRLSGALKVAGQFTEAIACDRKALEIRERRMAKQPNRPETLRDMAESYSSMAVGLTQVGDWNGTLLYRHKALSAYLKVIELGSRTPEDMNGLALAYMRMGTILTREKQYDEAVQNLQRAMDVARQGLREAGRNQPLRMTETAALRSLANLELERGRPDEAIRHFQAVNAIYRQMVAADPDEFRVRSMLAATHHRLGQAFLQKKDSERALEDFETGLTMRRQLAERNPANAGAQGEVAESLAAMAELFELRGERERAREWYGKAKSTLAQLEAAGRANSASRAILDHVNQKLNAL